MAPSLNRAPHAPERPLLREVLGRGREAPLGRQGVTGGSRAPHGCVRAVDGRAFAAGRTGGIRLQDREERRIMVVTYGK